MGISYKACFIRLKDLKLFEKKGVNILIRILE